MRVCVGEKGAVFGMEFAIDGIAILDSRSGNEIASSVNYARINFG